MKNSSHVLHALLFLMLGNGALSQESIEGLFYLDQSPVKVEILDGKISHITRIPELTAEAEQIYIAPGLIDNQVNGFAGVSFGFAGGKLDQKAIQKATEALWECGVTTYLPTLTTNDQALLLRNLAILADAMDDPALCGSIPGIHLEGPYISPEDGYRGAHPRKYVRKPDWNEFMELYEASEGNILQVTLAPDMEGAMDFISRCREKGIVVALGHHNGSSEQITEAIDLGARIATHLGNGMANSINRHVNPLWPQLADKRLMISIICDGFHLRPEEIKVFYGVKGPQRTIITSDVTSYAALPPGEYTTPDGETIELTPEGMLRYPAQKVLYGSASPITKGVGHIMKVTGCRLNEAIQMASGNVAELYSLKDRGMISPGMRADLILFTLEDHQLDIRETYVSGVKVYDAAH